MEFIFANLFRGVVTNTLNIILISSLAELKYSKKITNIVGVIICALVTILTSYFYIFYDITIAARLDLVLWILVGLGGKLMFTDGIMKWLFNLVTAINVFFFVFVISYILSRHLPYPMYANIAIRVILYVIFIILFKKFLHPLYRQVLDRWRLFLSVAVACMMNFIYIIITSQNLAETITKNLIPILLLAGLIFFAYATIIWSFGSIIREYEFRTEKEQARMNEELLSSQLEAYEEFVEVSKHNRHDLRHHNQIIIEYLKSGNVKGAEEYLGLYDASITKSAEGNYCKNYIANALLCLYAKKAHGEEITFAANADIPETIGMTAPELGSMLSNILENALESCRKTKANERFITFTAEIEEDILKIELQNTVNGEVEIRDNMPVSIKKNGGTGMKSVLNILEHYHGMLNFSQMSDTFITQIVLPI